MGTKKKTKDDLSVYILLDRSGSMSGSKWENAIGAINSYTHELKKEETVNAKITVAAFDSSGGFSRPSINWNNVGALQTHYSGSLPVTMDFTVLREETPLNKYKDIDYNEISPRGGTPLYDATAKLLNMADKNNNDKTVVIIMTDGEENMSNTYNLTSIRDRISTCQHRGWEVIFLGAEFNADVIARSYGIGIDKVVNSSTRNFSSTMNAFASGSAAYATKGQMFNTTSLRTEDIK